ncbi:hypothetical protein RCO27_17440 [Sphingosinicella sp. LHD-64]|uniref:hypothetical protein n=1 Tax=Sphingosinicella sp. LHD-64 TaxID=3072139 RepID=UPI00280F3F71|nr:hypothetical protein [Sphingosinicella sp. LHD-64]MDQ8758013.1 hypothetical protein [Sphingosinicella sp. LHD-64]
MNFKRLLTAVSASALALSPVAAQAAAPLSVATPVRAAAPMDDANSMAGSAGIALGVLLLVAIIAIAVSNDSDEGTPASP